METYTIGELNESSLHKALKARYMEPELSAEVLFEGYVVDLLGKEEIIEIQTANFSGLKAKLRKLLDERDVRLVYPLPKDKWIVKLSSEGEVLSRRLSPKHCHFDDAFHELVYIAEMLSRPNLKVEILLIQEEEIRVDDGRGSWRRKGVSIRDHRLLNVLSSVTLENPRDYLCFLPDCLGETFTNQNLAEAGRLTVSLARKITYTLRKMGLLEVRKTQDRKHYYAKASGGDELE